MCNYVKCADFLFILVACDWFHFFFFKFKFIILDTHCMSWADWQQTHEISCYVRITFHLFSLLISCNVWGENWNIDLVCIAFFFAISLKNVRTNLGLVHIKTIKDCERTERCIQTIFIHSYSILRLFTLSCFVFLSFLTFIIQFSNGCVLDCAVWWTYHSTPNDLKLNEKKKPMIARERREKTGVTIIAMWHTVSN